MAVRGKAEEGETFVNSDTLFLGNKKLNTSTTHSGQQIEWPSWCRSIGRAFALLFFSTSFSPFFKLLTEMPPMHMLVANGFKFIFRCQPLSPLQRNRRDDFWREKGTAVWLRWPRPRPSPTQCTLTPGNKTSSLTSHHYWMRNYGVLAKFSTRDAA